MLSMTKYGCEPGHSTVTPARLRGWGAGVIVFGLGAALAAGAMPAIANEVNAPTVATPWAAGTALPATGLSSQTVGFHANQPVALDQAALPKHAANRVIVDVTTFGADPTGVKDSAKAVNDAILHAKSLHKPTTILFPCGVYSMYPENAPKRELYVSNTVGADPNYKTKSIGLLIEDMEDVIVEGMGSQLTFHGSQTEFANIRSTDVTIQNLDTDWYAAGTLDLPVVGSGVADGFGYRDIQVPVGVNVAINGATATFNGENSPATGLPYWTHAPSGATGGHNQTRDLATGQTLRTGVQLWNNSRAVTDLGNGVYRVSYNNAADPGGTGKAYEIRKTTRDTPGGLIWESQRTALKNMKLHYLHGFGIVGQFSKDVALDAITLRTDFGTGRQTAAFADFIQMSGIAGKVQITNSLFDNPHDDPINIHGTYVEVKAVDRAAKTVTLQYMHNETAGFPQFYAGDELRFVKKATMLPEGATTFKVASVDGPTGKDSTKNLTQMTVTLDGELPTNLAASQFVAENLTYTPEVYIAGNTFQSVPTRGILVTTPREVLIERNVFDQMGMASIYISADAASWYESSGVDNVNIRNNVFDRPSTGSATIFVDPTNSQSEAGKAVHHGINIAGNRFSVLPGGQLVSAKSVSGLDFTANTVNHYAPTNPVSVSSSKALFNFSSSADIDIAGNTYEKGFNLRANTSGMDAAEVRGTPDAIVNNGDNITPLGNPASPLATGMGWVREDVSKWTAVDKNTVTLKAGSSGLWATQNAAVNILRQNAPLVGDATMVVKMSGATASQYEEAGLILYSDDDNYVALQRKHANGSPVLALVTETGGSPNENTKVAAPAAADVWLKLVRAGNQYTASYSTDNVTFTTIGTVTNATVTNGKTGILAVGASSANAPFTFTDLLVNTVAQPFFEQVNAPEPAKLVAGLAAPVWTGVQFAAPSSPLAALASVPAATKSVSTKFTAADASTGLQVQFNDKVATAGSGGAYTFNLMPGANVVQVQTMGSDGVSSQTYRWVISRQGALNKPGANLVCAPVVVPTTPPATVPPTTAPPTTVAPTTAPPTLPPVTTAPPTTTSPSVTPPATTAPATVAPSGSVDAETVSAGGELTVTGKNFKPGTTATFTLHSNPVVLGTAVVAADGTVSLTATVPANALAGAHTVVITGTGINGEAAKVSIAVTVAGGTATGEATTAAATTAAAAADDLASTGASGSVVGGLAVALVLGGLVLFWTTRRRAANH
ncbi:hypothetical protein CVS27_12570 [Arthrobacter glacialis]|uniref:DUF1349 domain-containing protein n=2 Tax=Arthrobacter glacialis TaxID=1664 RepID=A0A2S3ZUR7_ARTGL|nr:hypothetical protein CVS27_12570 [Arthrobacter glacialis]